MFLQKYLRVLELRTPRVEGSEQSSSFQLVAPFLSPKMSDHHHLHVSSLVVGYPRAESTDLGSYINNPGILKMTTPWGRRIREC